MAVMHHAGAHDAVDGYRGGGQCSGGAPGCCHVLHPPAGKWSDVVLYLIRQQIMQAIQQLPPVF